MRITVTVEWMDGVLRTYQVGGVLPLDEAVKETDGLLILWYQNGTGVDRRHITTIPMANIREYEVAK